MEFRPLWICFVLCLINLTSGRPTYYRKGYGYYPKSGSRSHHNPASNSALLTSRPNRSILKNTFSPSALLREVLSQPPRGRAFFPTSGFFWPGSYRLPSNDPPRSSYGDTPTDPMEPPPMTLEDMQAMQTIIEQHTRPKEANNTADYTGSRVLLMLLREECSRIRASRDVNIAVFCTQFDARFGNL